MPRINASRALFSLSGFCLLLVLPACGDDLDFSPVSSSSSGTASASGSGTAAGSGDASGAGSAGAGKESAGAGASSSGAGEGGEPDTTSSQSGEQSSSQNSDSTSSSDTGSSSSGVAQPSFMWLEDPSDPRVPNWVKSTNEASKGALEAQPGFTEIRGQVLDMVKAEMMNQLPAFSKIGDYVYTFMGNPDNPMGSWLRQSYEEFKQKPGANWEPVLNLDELAKKEEKSRAWAGANCLPPAGERCMINLMQPGTVSIGETREFDPNRKRFVTGSTFDLPKNPAEVSWLDRDNIYIGADFGGDSMTNSGMPRTVRKLRRGASLADAPVVFEGQANDESVSVSVLRTGGLTRIMALRQIRPGQTEYSVLDPETHKATKLDFPKDSLVGFWGTWMICQLGGSDWSVGGDTWEAGSVLVIDEAAFMKGQRRFTRLFEPGSRRALINVETMQNHIVVATLENNKGRIHEWSYTGTKGWTKRSAQIPRFGNLKVEAVSHNTSDEYFLTYMDFLTPPSIVIKEAGSNKESLLVATRPSFDATGLEVQQFFATSKDGTKIPYFQIGKKGLKLDGKNPTIVFGDGGFGVPLTPGYRGGVGIGWLSRGGVYVLANIRGGGEFGPAWHQAAVKENRQRSFDDFIAVGEDLVARGVSSRAHMGVHGQANGGLLAGVMMTQRPDLWGAVVSQNPILDMQRFHVIPGGSSWITEYGNPGRAQDLEYLLEYSPFHQVKRGSEYPPLFLSSRSINPQISPAHARKMMARMLDQGHKNVFYYESTNGPGQGGNSPSEQRAYNAALIFSFFAKHLGLSGS